MLLTTTNITKISKPYMRVVITLGLVVGLSGCDYVKSMFTPKSQEEQYEDGVALGAGCRQAGQTLEECYTLNPKSMKSGIYAGWKEMHEYMAAMNIKSAADNAKVEKPEDVVKQIIDPKQDPGATAPKDDLQVRITEAREKREARRAQLEKERDDRRERRLKAREAQQKRQDDKNLATKTPATGT